MNPSFPWKFIRPFAVGGDTLMTYLMMSKNGEKGIMKIVDIEEATIIDALSDLSTKYPYYVRTLHKFECTDDDDLLYEGLKKWDNNDYEDENDSSSSKENTYGIKFGTGNGLISYHYIFEKLDYMTDNIVTDNPKILLITTIHMLLGIYIAKDLLNFSHGDYQIMYRRVDPDIKYIDIKYKDLDISLPNIGFIPVMYDYGHSSVDGRKSNDLMNVLKYFKRCNPINPFDIFLDDFIQGIYDMFYTEYEDSFIINSDIKYSSSVIKDVITHLIEKL